MLLTIVHDLLKGNTISFGPYSQKSWAEQIPLMLLDPLKGVMTHRMRRSCLELGGRCLHDQFPVKILEQNPFVSLVCTMTHMWSQLIAVVSGTSYVTCIGQDP